MITHQGGCHCGRVRFEVDAPAELCEYRFNTDVARHLFCKTCGVKSFYVPRSHPDGYSVNARALDLGPVAKLVVTPFDGANWEAQVSELPGFGRGGGT